jgi:hypothetical protein
MHAVSLTPHARYMRCHWYHMHGACGVIDTACTIFAFETRSYLGKFEAEFKKALARDSGAQGVLFDEKTEGRKFRDTVPLSVRVLAPWIVNIFSWKCHLKTRTCVSWIPRSRIVVRYNMTAFVSFKYCTVHYPNTHLQSLSFNKVVVRLCWGKQYFKF